jgi:hypothetical protein
MFAVSDQFSSLSSPELRSSIDRFDAWLERHGDGLSHDPYDLWGTRYGLFSRRLYYAKHPLGVPLIAPLLLAEILCPSVRVLLVGQQRFATSDAQLALAFLNLHALEVEPLALRAVGVSEPNNSPTPHRARLSTTRHLERAEEFAAHLLRTSIPGYRGHCWGYPFDWQNNHGLWKRNTPFITATPYCFEVFLGLHDATGEPRHLEVAASIARFVQEDLHDTPTSADAAAGSYSPNDHSQVLNASAYRVMVLAEAARRFNEPRYAQTAQRNLNFILQNQRADGAWLYALDHPSERFIDHFHTCFVIKNLIKVNRHLQSDAVTQAITKGYEYYRRELFDAEGLPKSFTIQPRTQLVKLEMYNFAEAITLGAMLKESIPAAFAHAQELAAWLISRHQLADGHFTTRVYRGGWRHTVPFIRWPQSQIFYALTNLLRAGGYDE